MPLRLYSGYRSADFFRIRKLLGISYLTLETHAVIDGRTQDYWELLYVDKGELTVMQNQTETILRQGDVIFWEPGQAYSLCVNRPALPNVFFLAFTCHSAGTACLAGLHMQLPPYFRRFITEMYCEGRKTFDIRRYHPAEGHQEPLKRSVLGGTQMIRTYLEQFLIKIVRKSINTGSFCVDEQSCGPVSRQIIGILEQNIYGKVTVSDLCQTLNYGKTYVCTGFRKATGMTVMQYYCNLKMTEAKKLIRERHYNVSEIAAMLFYTDAHYFTNVFKKNTGMTPKQYLSSIRND